MLQLQNSSANSFLGAGKIRLFKVYHKASVEEKRVLAPVSFFKDIINPYNCFFKNANFSIKTSNKKPVYRCFEWNNSFFFMILQ